MLVVCLKKKGYEILEKNYTTSVGEIDIIAVGDGYLVFFEVKLRYDDEHGFASEAVNFAKRKKINQVASQYINQFRMFDSPVRFDVIEVYTKTKEINHIENAFDSYLRY